MTRFAPDAASAPHRRRVGDVALHEGDARQVRRVDNRLQAAAVAALIEHDRLVATRDARIDHPRADTAERTSQEVRGGHTDL